MLRSFLALFRGQPSRCPQRWCSASAMGAGLTARRAAGVTNVEPGRLTLSSPTGCVGRSSGSPHATSTTIRQTALWRTSQHGASAATCCTTGQSTGDESPSRCCCVGRPATSSWVPTGFEAQTSGFRRERNRHRRRCQATTNVAIRDGRSRRRWPIARWTASVNAADALDAERVDLAVLL